MLKFKKVSKIWAIIIIVSFLFNSISYGVDAPNYTHLDNTLRPMMTFGKMSLRENTAHFSLISKNYRFREQRDPVKDKFQMNRRTYNVNELNIEAFTEQFRLGDEPITIQAQNGQNITFTICGSPAHENIGRYLRENPTILKQAVADSLLLHKGDLPQKFAIILADRYDFFAGDHRQNKIIILNASMLEEMIDKQENPVFISELLTRALSEELAHERGAGSDSAAEDALAQKCTANTVFSLLKSNADIDGYIEFVQKYGDELQDQKGYLGYLRQQQNDAVSLLIDLAYDMLREKGELVEADFVNIYPMDSQKASVLLGAMYERYGGVEREREKRNIENFKYIDGIARRVKENVEMLRAAWFSNPEKFIAPAGQKGLEVIFKYMQEDQNCSIGYGDTTKTAAFNKGLNSELVDKLIPLQIGAISVLLDKYGIKGKAVRISGDEVGFVAIGVPSAELNNFRLEMQATLAEFIKDLYGFVKVGGVNEENMQAINEVLVSNRAPGIYQKPEDGFFYGVMGSGGIPGIYKDKDGFFMVFDKRISEYRNLEEACRKTIGEINKAKGTNIEIAGVPVEIPSPRFNLGFGILKASRTGDAHRDYGVSIKYAEYVRNISNENGLNGATSAILGELDRFDENMEKPTIPKLSIEERKKIADEYRKKGIKIYYDQIDEYYPAIKREYLHMVMKNMASADIGSAFLARGPPDNFYIVVKDKNGSNYLVKAGLIYEPQGGMKEKVDEAIREGKFTRDALRYIWLNGYGFKIINEFSDHQKANEVIRAATVTLKDIVDSIDFENFDFTDLANTISKKVSDNIVSIKGIDARVKVICSVVKIDSKDKIKYGIAIADDLTKIAEPALDGNGNYTNVVTIYDENESDKFNKRLSDNRHEEREKFYQILQEAYSKPVLTNADLRTYKRIEENKYSPGNEARSDSGKQDRENKIWIAPGRVPSVLFQVDSNQADRRRMIEIRSDGQVIDRQFFGKRVREIAYSGKKAVKIARNAANQNLGLRGGISAKLVRSYNLEPAQKENIQKVLGVAITETNKRVYREALEYIERDFGLERGKYLGVARERVNNASFLLIKNAENYRKVVKLIQRLCADHNVELESLSVPEKVKLIMLAVSFKPAPDPEKFRSDTEALRGKIIEILQSYKAALLKSASRARSNL